MQGAMGLRDRRAPWAMMTIVGALALPLSMRGPKARFEQSRGTIRLRSGTVREQAGDSSGIKGISRGNRPEKAEMTQLRT